VISRAVQISPLTEWTELGYASKTFIIVVWDWTKYYLTVSRLDHLVASANQLSMAGNVFWHGGWPLQDALFMLANMQNRVVVCRLGAGNDHEHILIPELCSGIIWKSDS